MGEWKLDPNLKAEVPAGSFNFMFPREFLEKLLQDKAIYAYVGPYTFFFQLDDGQKPIVETVEEFHEKRGEVEEYRFGRTEAFRKQPKDIPYV
jgi:hypothetical protein